MHDLVYDEEVKIDVSNTMTHKEDLGVRNNVEILNTINEKAIENQIPWLPVEWFLTQPISMLKKAELKETEALATLEAQPPQSRFKPFQWEDLKKS